MKNFKTEVSIRIFVFMCACMYVCTSYLLYLVHECIHMKILHDTSHCRSQFPDIDMEVINAGLNGDHIFMRSRLYDDVLVNVTLNVCK